MSSLSSTPVRAETVPEAAPRRVQVSWPHVVLSLLGAGVSLYAWHLHGVIKAGGSSGCGFSETLSCDKVIGSSYGQFFGIPLGVFGLFFFAIVLLCSVSTQSGSHVARATALQRLAVSSVGVLSSLALTYISIAEIGAKCPVCMTTHAITFALFGVSLWQLKKLNHEGTKAQREE